MNNTRVRIDRRQRGVGRGLPARAKFILWLLWQMPLASVSDLASRHELAGISRTAINNAAEWLYDRDYVGLAVRGWSQKAKRRYYLHSKRVCDKRDQAG